MPLTCSWFTALGGRRGRTLRKRENPTNPSGAREPPSDTRAACFALRLGTNGSLGGHKGNPPAGGRGSCDRLRDGALPGKAPSAGAGHRADGGGCGKLRPGARPGGGCGCQELTLGGAVEN